MIPIWKLSGRMGNQMFQLAYLYSQLAHGNIDDIYVQDESYFQNVKKGIKQLYREGVGEQIDAVSIHVRRGDFLTNDFDVKLGEDYYKQAMALFPDEKFIVFSDDIAWCKEQEMFKGCEFAGGDEIADFNRMTACKHNIIANSSYSWWAAYLNNNPDKKVVCPKYEYLDKVERRIRPNAWIRI